MAGLGVGDNFQVAMIHVTNPNLQVHTFDQMPNLCILLYDILCTVQLITLFE
jgi:hypothetical protein